MSSMLSNGVSGLLAFQSALNTTSHNISNASTTGYSRQSVTMGANQGQWMGYGWQGTGVSVTGISRSYNELVAAQVRASSSGKSQWDTYSTLADNINNLLSDSSTGISATLQNLFDAFQGVANSPTTSSERQVLLSKVQATVDQFQSYFSTLSDLGSQVNSQLQSEADTINQLAQNLAQLNGQITDAFARGGAAPNDMLDQRDAMLDELSTHVSISTVKQDNGAINVFVGNGLSLVVGTTASHMTTVTNEYDVSRQDIALQSDTGVLTNVTESMSGGALGGLLSFRSEVLDPSLNSLGLAAVSLTSMVNAQQNAGMDLYGDLGTDLLAIGDPYVADSTDNTGTATLAVTRSDVTALTGDNYLMTYTASGWQLRNAATGSTVTMTGAGTAASPYVAAGIAIEVSGTAAVGDSFLVKPVAGSVDGMSLLISDPSAIAAAAPIVAAASRSNTGTGTISSGVVSNASNASLRTSVTIEFLSATTYTTDGGTTTQTYTSGSTISLNGWQVTISGAPATGDTFTVSDNASGTGDNRNALLMANLLNSDYLSGGTRSLNDVVGTWVSGVGVNASQAQANLSAQTILYQDNLSTQQSISGVNTDEEAANLIRYQQAYAAAAQVVAAANKLFDTLLNAVS